MDIRPHKENWKTISLYGRGSMSNEVLLYHAFGLVGYGLYSGIVQRLGESSFAITHQRLKLRVPFATAGICTLRGTNQGFFRTVPVGSKTGLCCSPMYSGLECSQCGAIRQSESRVC